MKQSLLQKIPSVDNILKSQDGLKWLSSYSRKYVIESIRQILQGYRKAIIQKEIKEIDLDFIVAEIQRCIEKISAFSLKSVINATGIVIHTNLGRSLLSEEIMEHVKKISCNYSNLEYDIENGCRGKRYSHIQKLITDITKGEAGIIVNNNAAAVFISLCALAKGREVIVSRGELVEIGGSFRIPDVMANSGAILREVGATNKTHIYDYQNAINENTSLLLKVHQSNFKMSGFTKSVSIPELVELGKKNNLPVMFDLGSGCISNLKPFGISIEPTVQEIIQDGTDIVTFSGDKLLGGPQAGVIVGKSKFIEKIARHPLMRAMRVDKMTLAAFEATLMYYLDEGKEMEKIPTLKLLLQDINKIRARARRISMQLKKSLDNPNSKKLEIKIVEDISQSGGGALAEVDFKTFAIALRHSNLPVNILEKRLRHNDPPIISRIQEDTLFLDARTILDNQIKQLIDGIKNSLKEL